MRVEFQDDHWLIVGTSDDNHMTQDVDVMITDRSTLDFVDIEMKRKDFCQFWYLLTFQSLIGHATTSWKVHGHDLCIRYFLKKNLDRFWPLRDAMAGN